MDAARRVLLIAYDDAQILDIACPSGAFDMANRFGTDPRYRIELVSPGGRPVLTSASLAMATGRPEAVTATPGAQSPRILIECRMRAYRYH
ncbi:hypothetical protein [Nocardia crassostreae]|uniref:hypothetical protein n=1 Tax=Nocardia crassostreae TaxID=53428 RepID=UPI000835DE8D|nr:hypothetical protein [Nocardia crassostreae]